MKLAQGQIWQVEERFLRIVAWERLAIGYKEISHPEAKEGERHQVTKKEFCRLIKGGSLWQAEETNGDVKAADEI
jgi:hypothetical protein